MRVEPGREELLVATVGPDERIVGSARFVADGGAPVASAEVAFVVEEDFQGLGIAGRLFAQLADRARSQGIRAFTAEVLPRQPGDARRVQAQRAADAATPRRWRRPPDAGARR